MIAVGVSKSKSTVAIISDTGEIIQSLRNIAIRTAICSH